MQAFKIFGLLNRCLQFNILKMSCIFVRNGKIFVKDSMSLVIKCGEARDRRATDPSLQNFNAHVLYTHDV